MKIILTSDLSFLLKYGYDLTGISKSKMKIGYVTTASNESGDKTLKYPIRILRDGQGILVENGEAKFYGEQNEIILK